MLIYKIAERLANCTCCFKKFRFKLIQIKLLEGVSSLPDGGEIFFNIWQHIRLYKNNYR